MTGISYLKAVVEVLVNDNLDSISLYDETKDKKENAHTCNNFISNCIEKCSKDLEGTYFNAVIDD